MNNIQSIRELFEPLGNRLYEYESKKYLDNNPFGIGMQSDYPFDESFQYEGLMESIGKEANLHDPSEIYREASYYAGRIKKVIKNLKRKTHKSVWNSNEIFKVDGMTYPLVKQIELPTKEQDSLFKNWLDELNFCLARINELMYARSHVIPKSKDDDSFKPEVKQINLPEKLPIKQLTKHFEPYLSPIQGAQLLQYLKDLQVIPPYGPTDIGRIGSILFARHNKSISDGLLSIENLDMKKDDLKKLLSLLSDINKQIEKDLKLIN